MKKNNYPVVSLLLVARSAGRQPSFGQSPTDPQDMALVGAKIYPSPTATPITNGTVIIRHGKIAAVGDSRQVHVDKGMKVRSTVQAIGADGRFLELPCALLSSQMAACREHPVAQFNAQMEDMLTSHGFAHVFELATFDLSNTLAMRNRIRNGEVNGPVIYTVGIPFTPPNGSPFYIEPLKLPELSTPQEAIDYVKKQIDSGADAIKILVRFPRA